MRGLLTALRTLTILRVPGRDADSLAQALPYFPLVGALLGGAVAGVGWLLSARGDWALGGAVLGVALVTALTGGLHLDGLADATDGLSGGRTRERMLEIMKDSRIGAMGAIALVLVLLLKTVALARLLTLQHWAWLPLPFLLARTVQVYLALALPYARPEGGTAAGFVRDARPAQGWAAAGLALLLGGGLAGGVGLAAWLFAGAWAWLLGDRLRRRVGGITDDLLGMGNELTETLLLVLLAAAG